MGKSLPEKSRCEKRKESRSAKKRNLYEAWLEHQKSQKLNKASAALKSANVEESKSLSNSKTRRENSQILSDPREDQSLKPSDILKRDGVNNDSYKHQGSATTKIGKVKKSVKRRSKAKFEEYLLKDIQLANTYAEEDLELERTLAKKLKVKEGKLCGLDDGLNEFFEPLSDLESEYAEENGLKRRKKRSLGKKSKRQESDCASNGTPDSMTGASESQDVPDEVHSRKGKKKTETLKDDSESHLPKPTETSGEEEVPAKPPVAEAKMKYIAPHLRTCVGSEPKEHSQLHRRVRGLLNRLSESNVESITGETATIYQSLPRNVGSQILSEEVLASCAGGPRGNEQYAAVFAAFVAGMACLVGVDFSATLMASLAKYFEDEYLKENNLSLRNLTLLLSHLCIFGVCSSDLIYDFLITLSRRLTEIDVATILTILQSCGMKIRSDDPTAMKNFIMSVQNKVNELKASTENGQKNINGKRMEFMLETICDLKNNKKRTKEDSAPHTRMKKWLQKLRVEDVLIRGIKWSKLLDPNKKGQWWLSGDIASVTDNVAEVASTIDKEVLEARRMLELASAQSMNTDARRAIFCVIMSGEDYIDAFEKLLRLDLPGKQDRDIIRVLVECCLQEKVFNEYYTVLASKLCEDDKNHKFTMQFCFWDHFKKLEEMALQRSMHLAKFVAEMVTSFTLSLAVLKTVDFSDPEQLNPKRIMHFRMLFESIFEHPESLIWNVFSRIAVVPELEPLRYGIEFFIKEYVLRSNKGFAAKFKVMKKALNNVEGILM
ncbi:nucleolar MIF4G domain-containing protein 1-like [Punica granatum]|uniref:Nucleolar MIF4G domain-containing protein 1-like n=1 Tax=Punica granatum TaxID=22663 RepID=A0A6P8D684_PUNGR|nr:nucleolar MIF4G domain-containing protein 1-like [Punica granatum]XP_031389995.1 nucleolar MIF4G domain-containing protein 1-like [Punica granatum]XP_031389996.1 nucleolar MIF4G domain-containing protein 1-like [Punica granatum]